ncbi:MAG: LamG domain-containing protein [Candidatus Aenigmarchaeota archaeon]|nr:LamG domain-containing protein [Candidatus Aenigmarchaeota archaeon]
MGEMRFFIVLVTSFLVIIPTVFAAIEISFGLAVVINSSEDQTSWELVAPEAIKDISYKTENSPVPIFMAIDTGSGDTVNFLSVCKNEGNGGGDNRCIFRVSNSSSTIYEGCESTDIGGGISASKGLSICRGSFSADSDVLLTSSALSGNQSNSLFFKLPARRKYGIFVIFNSPELQKESDLESMKTLHPMTNSTVSGDYSKYDWLFTKLRGLKDLFGKNITEYNVNAKSFLKGEGILIYPWANESNVDISIEMHNSSQMISTPLIHDEFDKLSDTWESSGDVYAYRGYLRLSSSGGTATIKSNDNFTRVKSIWKLKSDADTGNNYFGFNNCDNDGYLHFQNGYPRFYNESSGKAIGTCSHTSIDSWKTYTIEWNKTDAVFSANGSDICNYQGDFSNFTNCKAYASANINTVVLTVDEINILDLSDPKGKFDGRIIWIPDITGGEYILNITSGNITSNATITIEKDISLLYTVPQTNNETMVNEKLSFTRVLEIVSNNIYRPQVIGLNANVSSISDCSIDSGEDCGDNIIIQPGYSTLKTFSWSKSPIKMKVVREIQDVSRQSTEDRQYVMIKLNISNTDPTRGYSDIKAAIHVDGRCSVNDFNNLDWIPESIRERFCYIQIRELGSSESRIFNVSYYNDWIDLQYGDLRQDMKKESSVEKQYFTRDANVINRKKRIAWKDIIINASNNCVECVQNFSISKPVLFLDFDQEGSVLDMSDFDNNCVPKNGPEWVDGKFGKGLSFDGSDDYVDCGDSLDLTGNGMTIAFWVKRLDPGGTYQNLIMKHKDNYGFYSQWSTENKLVFGVRNGTGSYSAGGNMSLDEWNFITLTHAKNGDAHGYVNGEKILDADNWVHGATSESMTISEQSNPLNGTIDEFLILSEALSEDDVEILYDAAKAKTISDSHLFKRDDSVHLNLQESMINYKIENLAGLKTNNSEIWGKKIILRNTGDIDLFNVSVSIPSTPLDTEINGNITHSDGIKNLVLADGIISFSIPKLEKRKKSVYEINISIIPDEMRLEGKHVSGMFIKRISDPYEGENLVLWLSFDEATENITYDKSSYYDNDGILNNVGWGIGKSGSGLRFNGESSYITIPETPSLKIKEDMTISLWFKASNISGDRALVSKDNSFYLGRGYNGLYWRFMIWNDTSHVHSINYKIEMDMDWHSIIGVKSGNEMHLYFDGRKVASAEFLGEIETGKPIDIGRWKDNNHFSGIIDEVKIYNMALPEEYITKNMYEYVLILALIVTFVAISYLFYRFKHGKNSW